MLSSLRTLIAAALSAPLAAGAAPDSSAAYTAPTTTITATRDVDTPVDLPLAVTALGAEVIRRGERDVSLTQALRLVPGLVVQDRGNPAQGEGLTARGLGARAPFGVRGVKVLLDGIPLTTPDGTTQLGNIDLGAIEGIEVLRGPSSSLYGNSAGGVIAVHSTPPPTTWQVQPRLVVGSDGMRRLQARIAGGSDRHRVALQLRHLEWDGFRQHAEARTFGANALGHHQLADAWQLVWVLNLYDAPYLLNPGSLNRADAESRPRHARDFVVRQGASKKTRQLQGGLTLRRQDGPGRTEVTLYGVGRRLDSPIPGALIHLRRRVGGLRAVHARGGDLAGVPVRWQAGVDAEWQSDARREYDNEGLPDGVRPDRVPDAVMRGDLALQQGEAVRALAPFVAVDIRPNPRVRLRLGARLDRYTFEVTDHLLDDGDASGRRRFGQFSPSAGLSLRLAPGVYGYAHVAAGFQTPTTNELSNRVDAAGGFNPDLDPESIGSWEVGARGAWQPLHLSWDAALYRMTVTDLILPFQVETSGSEAVYYRNAGRARSRGAEVALVMRPTTALDLRLSGTWIDFTFDEYLLMLTPRGPDRLLADLSGNRVPGVPPWRWALAAVHQGPSGTRLEIEAEWRSGYWANDTNGPPAGSQAPLRDFRNPAATLVGLRWSAPVPGHDDGAEVSMGVDNLLDRRYNGSVTPNAFGRRFFEPAPGRTWYVGLCVGC